VSDATTCRLFLVEHDLQGLSPAQLAQAHRALCQAVRRQARRGSMIRYLQQILVTDEMRCLCLFEASGADAVRAVTDIAQFPLAKIAAVTMSRPLCPPAL
jgi:hypothetical protein